MAGGPYNGVQERRGSKTGLASIILGVLGTVISIVFVPFGLVCAVVAIAKRQVGLGIVGILCNLFALATSMWFWALLGLGAGLTLLD